MDKLKQYIADAVRTESQVEKIRVNQDALEYVLNIFIASGNLLDMIKKNVFYNKPINYEIWNETIYNLQYMCKQQPLMLPDENTSDLGINSRIFHSLLGIATESVELLEAVHKSVTTDVDIDIVNIREEYFDTMWYILIGHDAIKQSMSDTLDMGFEKLRTRYPEKFLSEHAINRDLESERNILEKYHK